MGGCRQRLTKINAEGGVHGYERPEDQKGGLARTAMDDRSHARLIATHDAGAMSRMRGTLATARRLDPALPVAPRPCLGPDAP
jgi:hypothetical protein